MMLVVLDRLERKAHSSGSAVSGAAVGHQNNRNVAAVEKATSNICVISQVERSYQICLCMEGVALGIKHVESTRGNYI